ncbi:MAG: adenylate/guanylate cyclase domain-containing protein [Thermoleophilaceae bacterium]|nr:adenylate/guanylate cyclase domain-containing protein [Thermoleophilaceae bacterium]
MRGEIRAQRACRRRSTPTFVFADLVGYTAHTSERGDAAAADLARQFRRMMCALSRDHGARQVKSMGDGVMIWSADAATAVSLAADALRRVGASPDLLPVRIGVHTGPAVRRGSDFYGTAVNTAARLADAAQPNEALVSEATWAMARCEFTKPVDRPRELLLRGLQRPVAAWRLA